MTTKPSTRDRQRAWRYGWLAEFFAAWTLRSKGYRILQQRYRTPVGEIDLIARRGSLLAFVEVKARTDLAAAAEATSPRQRRRIERAAEAYLTAHPSHAGFDIRFDLVLIAPRRLPAHIADAWRPESR